MKKLISGLVSVVVLSILLAVSSGSPPASPPSSDVIPPEEWHSPPSSVIMQGSMIESADFIVFTDGENYYVKSGDNGEVVGYTSAVSAIQYALDSVPENGGVVYLASGTYVLDNYNPEELDFGETNAYSLKIGKPNTTLVGPRSATLRIASGINPDGIECYIALLVAAPRCTLTGFTFDGNWSGQTWDNTIVVIHIAGRNYNADGFTADSLIIENVGLAGTGERYAIYLFTVDDVRITNVRIENVQGTGIVIDTATNVTIANNVISYCGEKGIDFTDSKNIVTMNNVISSCSQKSDATYSAIAVSGGENNLIIGNRIRIGGENRTKYGIEISATVSEAILFGNDLTNSGATGDFYDASGKARYLLDIQSGRATSVIHLSLSGVQENTVSFPVAFPAVPDVVITLEYGGENNDSLPINVWIKDITTTGFTFGYLVATPSATDYTENIRWIATVA